MSTDLPDYQRELPAFEMEYLIKCPKCADQAVGVMVPIGTGGNYLEAFYRMGARRLLCEHCGMVKDAPAGETLSCEYWYSAEYGGHRLWARNRQELVFIISVLRGEVRVQDLDIGDHATVAGWPKWMSLAKNRAGILRCFEAMLKT